ncbi:hypothetical protein E1286_45180, partial [Nonomuraea terrae]
MTQRDGDGMATGMTGSSDENKEKSEVPFDPDATGVIPKLTFDPPEEGGDAAKDAPKGAPKSGAEKDTQADAETTTAIRLPAPLHIG